MLGDSAIEAYPPLAVLAGWTSLLTGQTAAAERWAAMLETASFELVPLDGSASFESSRAMFRAAFCSAGPEQMLSDASFAVAQEPAGSPWLNTAVYLLAEAHLLTGDVDQAARCSSRRRPSPRRCPMPTSSSSAGPSWQCWRWTAGGGRRRQSVWTCAGDDRRTSDGRQRPERACLRRCGASRCASRRPEAGECPAHAGDAGEALVQLGDAVSRRSVATTTRQGLLGHGRSCDGPSLVARDRRHPVAPTGTRRTPRRRLGASAHRHIRVPKPARPELCRSPRRSSGCSRTSRHISRLARSPSACSCPAAPSTPRSARSIGSSVSPSARRRATSDDDWSPRRIAWRSPAPTNSTRLLHSDPPEGTRRHRRFRTPAPTPIWGPPQRRTETRRCEQHRRGRRRSRRPWRRRSLQRRPARRRRARRHRPRPTRRDGRAPTSSHRAPRQRRRRRPRRLRRRSSLIARRRNRSV